MSSLSAIDGNRVYCHPCEHEWERAHGGLQCPSCGSEFVEVLEGNARSRDRAPEIPIATRPYLPPLHDHNPWGAPDPDEDDITTFRFNTQGGRGTVSFTSRTYTFGGNGIDNAHAEIGRNFQSMLGNIMGTHNTNRPAYLGNATSFHPTPQPFAGSGYQETSPPQDIFQLLFQGMPGGSRHPSQPTYPFEFLSAILNPRNAQHGDTVFSQEAFDRVMSQLMEQHQTSGAPGPASDAAINSLQKKCVDESMLGSDGKAECSICMDNVNLQDEVTVLPCNHWFHQECIVSWLKEHDTCPHCRKPITPQDGSQQRSSFTVRTTNMPDSSPSHSTSYRRRSSGRDDRSRPSSSRRQSGNNRETNTQNGDQAEDGRSPGVEARGGGVADWFRSHMSF